MNDENPIAFRSKQMITEALLDLMASLPYDKISITMLVDHAQVARKTFYRNFDSKDEVLDLYIEALFEQYLARLSKLTQFDEHQAVLIYFQFWQEHLDFLQALIHSKKTHLILLTYEKYLPLIDAGFQQSETAESPYYAYSIAFSSGGFWRLLCVWAEKGAVDSPEKMAKYYNEHCI